jgi:nitric oxide reductase large subunit
MAKPDIEILISVVAFGSRLCQRREAELLSYTCHSYMTKAVLMQALNVQPKRPMIIARSWLQIAVLTFAVGFGILGYLTYSIYNEHAPVPDRFVGPTDSTIFTRADVEQGQQIFATRGLMEQGTIFGHGAYLGPDFTADALHRMEVVMQRHYGNGIDTPQRIQNDFKLFTTIAVAYIMVLIGVVRPKTATRLIYLDIILYSIGGVVGTMHHLYFSGAPAVHMACGAFFSAMEVIPLVLLTYEAWQFMRLGEGQGQKGESVLHQSERFPHRWTVMFLAAVGFWNFVGAGVFGFLINLPIVSFWEIGTQFTATMDTQR